MMRPLFRRWILLWCDFVVLLTLTEESLDELEEECSASSPSSQLRLLSWQLSLSSVSSASGGGCCSSESCVTESPISRTAWLEARPFQSLILDAVAGAGWRTAFDLKIDDHRSCSHRHRHHTNQLRQRTCSLFCHLLLLLSC